MNTIIPVAKQSPRIDEKGTIIWYKGDAFTIDWTINLTEDDEPLQFQPGDKLEWQLFSTDDKDTPVHVFNFEYNTDDWPAFSNTVTLIFTKEISKKFGIGSYTYCVKFFSHDGRIVTLNASNKVKVEACH